MLLAYRVDQRAAIILTACQMPRSLLLHDRPTFWIFAYAETGLILLTLASAYRTVRIELASLATDSCPTNSSETLSSPRYDSLCVDRTMGNHRQDGSEHSALARALHQPSNCLLALYAVGYRCCLRTDWHRAGKPFATH